MWVDPVTRHGDVVLLLQVLVHHHAGVIVLLQIAADFWTSLVEVTIFKMKKIDIRYVQRFSHI